MGGKKNDEVKNVQGGSSNVKHTLSEKTDANGNTFYHDTSYSDQARVSTDTNKETGEVSGIHGTDSRTGKNLFSIPTNNENLGERIRNNEAKREGERQQNADNYRKK